MSVPPTFDHAPLTLVVFWVLAVIVTDDGVKVPAWAFTNTNELYIFCVNIYAKAVATVMINSGYLVKGFLDNNKLITSNHVQGLKIYLPSILSKKKISKYFVIICNQEKNAIHEIYHQLKKIGFKNDQITYKNFHKERNESF